MYSHLHIIQFLRPHWRLALLCLLLWTPVAHAEEKVPKAGEYQVKAAFLYNFIQFTDWPSNPTAKTNAPIVIGILGEDPFGKALDDVVGGELVRGRPLAVKRLSADGDLRGCQVLFIARSGKDQLPAFLNQLKGSPVLTIGDYSGFTQQGGMVNLLLVNKNVKMEINQEAVEQSGLQISAKLLKLARTVRP